ncbi:MULTISPECIES: polyamine ABC transporter substrate-binding protein [unclassified Marichromatium]|uniref:polyamine ABC transporter substrate-binding protein n=1 Tax=unclassified Marichromatium TaxID=2618417 RepID=UPI000F3B369F|nr:MULTISPECIES: polyamine ABC transporter substrate-binding protein [unclassified Marichromatium]MBO8085332.1 polyamine ABC transporter substrate-binding protein [Marichromatium sp.]RNE88509.1 polyamine ABC transporter substrate-binding protein [Marichromatium sp. AB31]RNE90305.1 polyamine ABC transporter substrate-binding protein [Marichromatium sp. AB32]
MGIAHVRKLANLLLSLSLWAVAPLALAEEQVHLYNWNDYFAEDTLETFEAGTGIRPVLDLYDANEILEAKLLAGSSGYDLIFPTARPFAARHIRAGLYLPLDKSQLPGLDRLDPEIMASLAEIDPDNAHLVPYMWGTSGLGINRAKVREILGDQVPLDTWALVFDPQIAARLAGCGIALLDDPTEVFSAALAYLGKDPNSLERADLDAAAELIKGVYPHIRYFHSSQYISDLANGDLCIAHGYSGDVLQAQERADEAGKGVEVIYRIPREGAAMWTDVMAIPSDAPNPEAAHAFIAHLLQPEVIAAVSDYVYYANPNLAATPLVEAALREDPGIYPPAEVKARLFVPNQRSDREIRDLNRRWTRLKANR